MTELMLIEHGWRMLLAYQIAYVCYCGFCLYLFLKGACDVRTRR